MPRIDSGTEHFPSAGKPSDTARVAAYARYDGVMDRVGERLMVRLKQASLVDWRNDRFQGIKDACALPRHPMPS